MKITPIGSNQTEAETTTGVVVLFSYSTPVAARLSSRDYWRTEKYWSRTTSRHINEWLDGKPAKEVPQSRLDELFG